MCPLLTHQQHMRFTRATQSHDSINITPSDASLVLEVLAEQGRVVAEAHREQISQVCTMALWA